MDGKFVLRYVGGRNCAGVGSTEARAESVVMVSAAADEKGG